MTDTSHHGTPNEAEKERPLSAARAIGAAIGQLSELLRLPVESVSSCERAEDGAWQLSVEVLELSRIPDTTSLLASYDVELDPAGELLGYRRTRRYERGRADRG
ncbi:MULTISPECIES: gas vesicle protein GvpO [unclassified Streptomyces]|uniref:Gas vesicle protein GvpO n=1 Tax=Streptomyces sp. R33 TaxID=3238629 RepID=A0AB39YDC2_9ACTN|nr:MULTISPECIES: gas vesicle protein GvpO [unclassified Streptomyces]TDU80362.1 gas vesicle protein GvpO [Streptomyces sp. KS 21]THA39732.1 gas vesicle protein [Streptomyces sp. A1547]